MSRINKSIAGIIGLSSILLFAGTISDMRFYSDSFMEDDEIRFEKRLDDISERYVASSQAKTSYGDYYNEENYEKIKGKWYITSNTYAFSNKVKMNLEVELELLRDGRVEVKSDDGQTRICQIMKLDGEYIRLKHELEEGQDELIEVQKTDKRATIAIKETAPEEAVVESKSALGLMIDNDLSLRVVEVSNFLKPDHKPEFSSQSSVEILLDKGRGVFVETDIQVGDKSLSISVPVIAGGRFVTDEEDDYGVSGDLSNNGSPTKFKLTIYSGEFEGMVFYLVSNDEEEGVESEENVAVKENVATQENVPFDENVANQENVPVDESGVTDENINEELDEMEEGPEDNLVRNQNVFSQRISDEAFNDNNSNMDTGNISESDEPPAFEF